MGGTLGDMCGRYARSRSEADLIEVFEVDEVVGARLGPSWNVAPRQNVRIITEQPGTDAPGGPVRRQLRTARWGLVPSWAKDPGIGNKLINARSETVTDKASFRSAAARRRCIVPADGYYEWQRLDAGGKNKQPYYLHPEGGAPLGLAGLYERWKDPALPADHPEAWRWTTTILTTTACDALGYVHDRSPVIVPGPMLEEWLDPAITDPADVREMVAAIPEPRLIPRPVAQDVGKVGNDGPHLIEAIDL